ncbi:MAG: nickel/cobalt transporter [Tabrizicola flagellatus]|uniref:nickel/cobalt transporter n=1 Tax=Tabrizicola flagellatus TaxID=2593021 RepID=UPI0039190857
MRRALMLAGLVLVLVLGVLWASGALGGLAAWLGAAQRAAQERLAGAIRALRGGEAGALTAFWALCLGYGVLHAAVPGHGKLVIGGYGLARRVPVARLAGLALASSLAQAAVAVALVYGLVALLGLGRQAVEGVAERWVTPVGHAMIAGLGLWLVWRGVQDLRRQVAASADAHGHHDHHHDHEHGPGCTHAHGPTVEAVEHVASFRDGLALVAGIALRPCSGALFVLVLTWQLGIALAGIVGAFVMGLGTALVTVGAAVLSVWAREGALQGLGTGRLARALPVVELAVGAAIAAAALGLLASSL